MSKLLPLCCLIALVSAAVAMPEASNSPSSANGNEPGAATAAPPAAAPRAPIWLSASALALPPPYPLYGPPGTLILQEPTYATVGEIVQKVPTAISHQSQTVVHNHANVVTPIVAPALRTQVLHPYNGHYVYSSYVTAEAAAAAAASQLPRSRN